MKQYWEIIRELREDRDLKQAEIAAVLKTTQQVYSRYEKGVNELPIRHLKTLCGYYRVSADYILGLSSDMTIHAPQGTTAQKKVVQELEKRCKIGAWTNK